MFTFQKTKTETTSETKLELPREKAYYQDLWEKLKSFSLQDIYQNMQLNVNQIKISKPQYPVKVPMKRNFFGLYWITVLIEGMKCKLIIDTGAQISGLKNTLCQKIGLKQLASNISVTSMAGNQKDMSSYFISTLQIEAIRIENICMIGLNEKDFSLKILDYEFIQFDGILGWDILSQFDFELDCIQNHCIFLENQFAFPYCNLIPSTFPVCIVYDEKANLLTMGIDTGAKYSWLSYEKSIEKQYSMGKDIHMCGFGVHGKESMEVKCIQELTIFLYKAKIHMQNLPTGMTKVFPNIEFDGILGNEIFHRRKIRFINSKGMILFA